MSESLRTKWRRLFDFLFDDEKVNKEPADPKQAPAENKDTDKTDAKHVPGPPNTRHIPGPDETKKRCRGRR